MKTIKNDENDCLHANNENKRHIIQKQFYFLDIFFSFLFLSGTCMNKCNMYDTDFCSWLMPFFVSVMFKCPYESRIEKIFLFSLKKNPDWQYCVIYQITHHCCCRIQVHGNQQELILLQHACRRFASHDLVMMHRACARASRNLTSARRGFFGQLQVLSGWRQQY